MRCIFRRLTPAARASYGITLNVTLRPPLSSHTHAFRGAFEKFFKPLVAGKEEAEGSSPVEPKAAVMSVDVYDLMKSEDMPPMLQYHESLVEAALELLEVTNSSPDVTDEQVTAVSGIISMLFCEELVTPWEQYSAVIHLTDIPISRQCESFLKACRAILITILPDSLAQLVCAMDSLPELTDATVEQRALVHHLVQVIIDNGGVESAAPEDVDRLLLSSLQSIESGFPLLFQHTNFIFLLQNMNRVCLQARFAYLINETCLAFDPDRTGRIRLQELEDSLKKIMPPPAVASLMKGVVADKDGKIYYSQMALMLMRGEGSVAPVNGGDGETDATKAPESKPADTS